MLNWRSYVWNQPFGLTHDPSKLELLRAALYLPSILNWYQIPSQGNFPQEPNLPLNQKEQSTGRKFFLLITQLKHMKQEVTHQDSPYLERIQSKREQRKITYEVFILKSQIISQREKLKCAEREREREREIKYLKCKII